MAKKNKKNKEKLSATYNYSNSKDNSRPSYSDCKDDCGCGCEHKSGMNNMNNMNNMDSKNCR